METLGVIPIGFAVLLAGAAVGAAAISPPKTRPGAFYAQLLLMVGIYVGFAIIRIDEAQFITRGDWAALLVESLTALIFAAVGLSVMNAGRAWLLGALILLHGVVDLLHLTMGVAHSPAWYALLCVIYDALAGVGAIWLLTEKQPDN